MNSMRAQFIKVGFTIVAVVFAFVIGIVYISLYTYTTYQADETTAVIAENGGIVPQFDSGESSPDLLMSEESQYRTRYFVVYLNSDMQPSNTYMDYIASVNNSQAVEMTYTVVSSGKTKGYVDDFRFRVASINGSPAVIFLDCYESIMFCNMAIRLVATTVLLIAAILTLIFVFFSKPIVKPFVENARKQKQFITDASHELKTPLAIISANAEVLAYKNGSNTWIENIISQTERMNKLVADLLTLVKMDEIRDFSMEEVDFSSLTSEVVNSFKEVFAQKNADIQVEISDNITLNGNTDQLKQFLSTLTENAAKYVNDGGRVSVSLRQSGKNAVFKIYNTAEISEKIDCKRLFDRFYRLDSSHSSETGGSGIGLSLARRIAEQHGGTLSAKQDADGICFIASIPTKLKISAKKTGDIESDEGIRDAIKSRFNAVKEKISHMEKGE